MKAKSKTKKDVSLFKAYLVEIRDRWFSSRKRIIKTIGVFTIPLIYGGVCIAAFWNPLGNVGTMPIALCSLDKEQMLIEDYNTGDQLHPVAIGIPGFYNSSSGPPEWKPILPQYLTSEQSWDQLITAHPDISSIKTLGGSIAKYAHTYGDNNPNGGRKVESLMDKVVGKWQNGYMSDSGFTYDSKKNAFAIDLGSGFPITNIKYHNTDNTDSLPNWESNANKLAKYNDVTQKWEITNNDDYAQITIPSDTSKDLISAIDASLSGNDDPSEWINQLQQEKINLYVTYDRTFLAARLIEESMGTMSSLITASLPMMGVALAEQYVDDLSNNIATISSWDDGTWNGGYSWEFNDQNPAVFELSGAWNDHRYFTSTEGGMIEEMPSGAEITFQPDTLYTIQNEELRNILIETYNDLSSHTTAQEKVYDAITDVESTDGPYIVPSIEGYTTDGATGYDKWNDTSQDATHATNASNSLLHKLSTITTAITQIPTIDDAVAELMNFYFNSKLDTLPTDDGNLISIDINGGNVRDLFASDEFLCSLLTQDPRFMLLDDYAPKVPIIGNILNLPITFGLNLRLGNIIALGCFADSDDQNIFQQYDFRSSYTDNNLDITDDASYHHGNMASDLLGGIIPIDNYDPSYAINNPTLPSALTSPTDTQDPFSYSNNLLHNFAIVESTLASAFGAINPSKYIDETVIGSEWSFYGIGLGQYFVCIGLCVGTLTQIMFYDKKKRVKRIRAKKWFVSKTMMMVSTSLIQSTVLAIVICAIGWWHIGNAMVYQWLFMIFCGLIFVCIIQAIWFSFRDRSLAFFCVVVFMVTNLAAGWGTFPAYMQWPVFEWLSYIAPFTYMIHVQSAIAYGVATGTNIFANSIYILENIAVLLVFGIAFYTLGIFMSSRRERDIYYGTCNAKQLGTVLKKLKYSQYYHETKKGPVADWKKIPHEEMIRVKVEAQKMFPYEEIIKSRSSKELVRDIVDFDNN